MTDPRVLGRICSELFYINQAIHLRHLFSRWLAELSPVGFPPGLTTKTPSLIDNQLLLISFYPSSYLPLCCDSSSVNSEENKFVLLLFSLTFMQSFAPKIHSPKKIYLTNKRANTFLFNQTWLDTSQYLDEE